MNRGRGHYPHRGGRGRGNFNNTSRANSQQPMMPVPGEPLYEEFKKFLASKEDNNPSFAKMITNEPTDDNVDYIQTKQIDEIIKIENKDVMLYFENGEDPWFLMNRYLDTASYAGCSYKGRMYYENILKTTGSVEFSHFTSMGNTNIYNFSKAVIKKIILPEEWGLSTLKEREFIIPPSKIPVKFTYWDYIDSFHKAFLYENPQKRHTWFFKVCENIYKQNKDIPSWFFNWWSSYGPSMDILPNEPFRKLYGEWLPLSPRYDDHIHHKSGDVNVLASLHFFMEFSIPWIWKWSVTVDYTPHKIPSLQRLYHTKFWPKMLQMDPETKSLYGQQVIDNIKNQVKKYQDLKEFSKTSQGITPKSGKTKEEMIKSFRKYCIQMKENLKEMEASSSKSDEGDSIDNMSMEFIAGESQAEDEDIPIECMIDMIEETLARGKNLSKDKMTMQ